MSKRYDRMASRLICFGAKASTNAPVGDIAPEPFTDVLYNP